MANASPSDVMSTNPYLAPMPPPDWRTVLANALIGVGAGISNADASGRGWGAGIAPGLMMGANMTAQQQQQAMQHQAMAGLRKMAPVPTPSGLNDRPPALTMGPAGLHNAGIPPTPENLHDAHRFGVDGEKRFITAPPGTAQSPRVGYVTNAMLNNPYMQAALGARLKNLREGILNRGPVATLAPQEPAGEER